MMFKKRRSFLFLLFLTLSSCTSKCFWTYRETIGDCPTYNSALLDYKPCYEFNGIALHFLKGSFGTQVSISILCSQFETDEILISSDENWYTFHFTPLEGAQCALLPEEASQFIIDSLLSCQDVTLAFSGHLEKVSWKGFGVLYKQLTAFRVPLESCY